MKSFSAECPNIVATVTQGDDLDFLDQSPAILMPDFLEFRLDNLNGHLELAESVIQLLSDGPGILTTVRHPGEGGAGDLSDNQRVDLYEQFLPMSGLIDTEVRSLQCSGIKGVVSEARKQGIIVIGSFHDFEGFPSREILFSTVERAYREGADIAKVAVCVDNFGQLNTLVELVKSFRAQGKAISAMGMGPLGRLSRLVLAKAGSCLNYGYLQKENAPGQWSAEKLMELVREI